jgi:hypothetical protein
MYYCFIPVAEGSKSINQCKSDAAVSTKDRFQRPNFTIKYLFYFLAYFWYSSSYFFIMRKSNIFKFLNDG